MAIGNNRQGEIRVCDETCRFFSGGRNNPVCRYDLQHIQVKQGRTRTVYQAVKYGKNCIHGLLVGKFYEG